MARLHTPMAMLTLATSPSKEEPTAARVAASIALLERGWGKPGQPVDADVNLRASYVIRAPSAIESAAQWLACMRRPAWSSPSWTGDNGNT